MDINDYLELERLTLAKLKGKMSLMMADDERRQVAVFALQEVLKGEARCFLNR